jgi:hypothetical protein
MKTWQAALSHIGLSALQAAGAVSYFNNSGPLGMLGNIQVQLGLQTALTALQTYVAKANSNSYPNGSPIPEVVSAHVAAAAEANK